MFVCFGSQVALEGLRPTIPPGISPHICKLMKICMNEDPAKRPKFDMIVPILEKMQDKWTPPPCPSVPEPLIPDGGVVLTSIALNSYTAASFKATIAPASETNIAVVTFIIVLFFFSFLMCCDIILLFVDVPFLQAWWMNTIFRLVHKINSAGQHYRCTSDARFWAHCKVWKVTAFFI